MYGPVFAECYRRGIILNCNRSGAGAEIAIYIRYGERDRIFTNITTIKYGLIKTELQNAAGIIRSITNLTGSNYSISGGIQRHCDVLAKRLRSNVVHNGYRGGTGAAVAAVIGGGKHYWIGSHISTAKFGLVDCDFCNTTGIIGASIYFSSRQATDSRRIQLNRHILA